MSAHHGRIARLQSIIARDARLVRLVTAKQRDAPAVPLPGRRVFEHVLARLLREASDAADCRLHPAGPGLVSVRPYWHYFWASAQPAWVGRTVLDVAAERFKPPRPREFYAYALKSGLLTLNGRLTGPGTLVRAGDQLQTVAHRHEPPVTAEGVRVISQSEDLLVVEKPGGVPVHPVGRYRYNCLTHMMKEGGLPAVRPVSRLDRLTSGVMLFPLSARAAGRLGVALRDGKVKKEYLARVRGRFPGEPILCKEKLLLVHRQLGLSIVHEEGKPSATAFARISYDARTDTSLVLCRPYTGRTHQIRVHLLHLGHPIPNDPYYSDPIWNASPSALDGSSASPELDGSVSPLELELPPLDNDASAEIESRDIKTESLPFELALPDLDAPDSAWRTIRTAVVRAKTSIQAAHADEGAHAPGDVVAPSTSPWPLLSTGSPSVAPPDSATQLAPSSSDASASASDTSEASLTTPPTSPPHIEPPLTIAGRPACAACLRPLPRQPSKDQLRIYLHALRYTTSEGVFEAGLPGWAL